MQRKSLKVGSAWQAGGRHRASTRSPEVCLASRDLGDAQAGPCISYMEGRLAHSSNRRMQRDFLLLTERKKVLFDLLAFTLSQEHILKPLQGGRKAQPQKHEQSRRQNSKNVDGHKEGPQPAHGLLIRQVMRLTPVPRSKDPQNLRKLIWIPLSLMGKTKTLLPQEIQVGIGIGS